MPQGAAGFLVLGFWQDFPAAGSGYGDPLGTVLNRARSVPTFGATTDTGPLDFTGLAEHAARNVVYQYEGSLTTPPCSEGVKWLVSGAPVQLAVGSYNTAKKVLKYNARFTQNSPGAQNLIEVAAESLRRH